MTMVNSGLKGLKDIMFPVTCHQHNTTSISPANTRRCLNVVLLLGRRRRRRANIANTLGQRIVFAGIAPLT